MRRHPALPGDRICLLCRVLRQRLPVLAAWRVTGQTGLLPTRVLFAGPPFWRSEAVLIAVRLGVAYTRHGKENEGRNRDAHNVTLC